MKKDITRKQVLNSLENNKNNRESTAKDLGISLRTLYYRMKEFGIDNDSVSFNTQHENNSSKVKVTQLENTQKKLLKELSSKNTALDIFNEVKNSVDFKGFSKSKHFDISTKSGERNLLIPTLFCSDEHWGEVVNPDHVNGMNEYNSVIARKRYDTVITNYLDIVHNQINFVDKERMILNLGGDNVSGDIHEELMITNDLTTMEATIDYSEHKIKGIMRLLDSGVKHIQINCVSGNHDRNTHKIQNKMRNETSFAYIIYRIIQMRFANDSRVEFNIAKGLDCIYDVNGMKMLLTHGDQFKGGNGIGGISTPILKGFQKKQSSLAAVGIHIKGMCIGHFHQYTSIGGENNRIIINGSLKGYDEYSQMMGFGYQRACQAMWLTHPSEGIKIQVPIYTE